MDVIIVSMSLIRVLLISFLICVPVSLSFATAPEPVLSQHIDDVEFTVIDVDRGTKQEKRYHMQTDWVQKETSSDGAKIDYIAITYQVNNKNPHKKINMDSSFQFHLLDEFENQYRKIPKPDEYDEPVLFTDKHYPSIYPGETLKETIFFEAPIASSTRLTLLIKATPLGEGKIVKLILPVGQNTTLLDQEMDALQKTVPVIPVVTQMQPRWVKIVYPTNGTWINRGEATQVHVEISGKPDHVIVATLGTSYYDHSPQEKNVYDVRVPFGYYTGPLSINVIAQWDDANADEPIVVSDSIFMDVQSPYRSLQGEDAPGFEYFQ